MKWDLQNLHRRSQVSDVNSDCCVGFLHFIMHHLRSERVTSPFRVQQERMERVEAKIHAKQKIRGKLYRRKKLEELKLGIKMTPIEDEAGVLDLVKAV